MLLKFWFKYGCRLSRLRATMGAPWAGVGAGTLWKVLLPPESTLLEVI
jgi:hypothetical protein